MRTCTSMRGVCAPQAVAEARRGGELGEEQPRNLDHTIFLTRQDKVRSPPSISLVLTRQGSGCTTVYTVVGGALMIIQAAARHCFTAAHPVGREAHSLDPESAAASAAGTGAGAARVGRPSMAASLRAGPLTAQTPPPLHLTPAPQSP